MTSSQNAVGDSDAASAAAISGTVTADDIVDIVASVVEQLLDTWIWGIVIAINIIHK